MKLTKSEEDYLKAIFTLVNEGVKIGTNSLAETLSISPASVNNMLKKLGTKDLVSHKKYGPIKLSDKGNEIAINLIRKHRLWETFLYEKLDFTWDEVHEVAEELEHVKSPKLIQRLAEFLGNPKYDPHGDPIPDESGKIEKPYSRRLSEISSGESCIILAVKDESDEFLRYATKLGLELNMELKVIEKLEFDGLMKVGFKEKEEIISKKFSENIFVE